MAERYAAAEAFGALTAQRRSPMSPKCSPRHAVRGARAGG
jgi:hypothetical protein